MKFINLTRATEIGANCYYLESGDESFILDCGMHPKREGDEARGAHAALAVPQCGHAASRAAGATV